MMAKRKFLSGISVVYCPVFLIMEPGKTYFSKCIDQTNNIVHKMNDYNLEAFGIYDNDNLSSIQYGGRQDAFRENAYELLQDPLIISRLKEFYPDASMEDYHLYLCKISSCGCGYTALVNTVFNEYQGREEEFKQKFGYPMYTANSDGDVDYNYEYMILDYFNYIWGNSGYTIQELYGNVTYNSIDGAISGEFSTGKAGGTSQDIYNKFTDFLNTKYNQKATCLDPVASYEGEYKGKLDANNIVDIYKSIINNGKNDQVMLWSEGYDLYDMYGNLYRSDGGSHAMYITGVTSDNKLIVSSWGKKFTVDLSNVYNNENGYMTLQTIEY